MIDSGENGKGGGGCASQVGGAHYWNWRAIWEAGDVSQPTESGEGRGEAYILPLGASTTDG